MSVSRPYEEDKAILRAHLFAAQMDVYDRSTIRAGDQPDIEVDLPSYRYRRDRIARILELAKKLPFVEAEFILKQYYSEISVAALQELHAIYGDPSTQALVEEVRPKPSDQEKERHQKLYIKAYQGQEFRNSARTGFETALMIASIILPPLSLVYTIKLFNEMVEHDRFASLEKPVKERAKFVVLIILSAIIPVLSGFASSIAMNLLRVTYNPLLKRENNIIKSSYSLFHASFPKQGITSNLKNRMIDVDRKELQNEKKKINKPRKAAVNAMDGGEEKVVVYRDKYQEKRRSKYLFGLNSNKPGKEMDTKYFTRSYQKSAALVEKLEQKYGKKI